jgi:hypothetical protein
MTNQSFASVEAKYRENFFLSLLDAGQLKLT